MPCEYTDAASDNIFLPSVVLKKYYFYIKFIILNVIVKKKLNTKNLNIGRNVVKKIFWHD